MVREFEGELRYDWGVGHNPASPRGGLLTFEHQGCRGFEPGDQGFDLEDLFRPVEGEGPAEAALLLNLRIYGTEINELLAKTSDRWGYEDPVYRFYHQSFKVYELQQTTSAVVALLRKLSPETALNSWFLEVVAAGTGKEFRLEDNRTGRRSPVPYWKRFFMRGSFSRWHHVTVLSSLRLGFYRAATRLFYTFTGFAERRRKGEGRRRTNQKDDSR